MPYRNEVAPLNLFGDFISGKQAAISQQAGQQQNALRSLQVQQGQALNALAQNPQATPEQFIRAGDVQGGMALNTMNQQGQMDKLQAAQELGMLAQKTLALPAAQRKAFTQQAMQTYGPHLQSLGVDVNKALGGLMNVPDAEFEANLQRAAQMVAPQAPIKVGANESLVTMDGQGGAKPIYTNPGAPKDTSMTEYQRQQLDIERQKLAQGKPQNTFAQSNTLRDEFNAQVKDYGTVQASYQNIVQTAKAPSAAGDIALLTSFMKMIDPGSTVREGEFATAQNASGVPEKIQAKYNQLLTGERLTPTVRSDFVNQAKNLFEGRDKQYKVTRKRYENQAQRYGLNPIDVVGEETNAFAETAAAPAAASGPVKVTSPQQAMALPSGTQFVTPDGRIKVRP